jgi:hypothetical protein
MSTCSCGASIVWAITENGKRIPLDADPEKRSVIVHGQELVKQTRPLILGDAFEAMVRSVVADTYTPHFASCPQASRFRR